MNGKPGIHATVIEIDEPGTYNVENGNEFTCMFPITAGIGGDPKDFQVTIEGDEGAVNSEQNFIVKKAGLNSFGSTTVIAVFTTKKEGAATITLGVKGVDKTAVYQINVVPAQPSPN